MSENIHNQQHKNGFKKPKKTAKSDDKQTSNESIMTVHIKETEEESDSSPDNIDDWDAEVKDSRVNDSKSEEKNEKVEKNNQDLSKPTKTNTIHIIDGEKGGVGKSFFTRAFIEYIQHKELEMTVVDADINCDISKIYTNCKDIIFSEDEKKQKEVDEIFKLAFNKSVLVNLPAQVYNKVTTWIDGNKLIDLGNKNSIKFIKWFVCSGERDSIEFFIQSQKHFENNINHILVKNYGLCDDWNYLDNESTYSNIKDKYHFQVINFPKLSYWERNKIDKLQINFSSALNHDEFDIISKQRIKNFIDAAFKEFASTKLIW